MNNSMLISNGVKKFEVLEHTADLKIRVFGRTKEELFKNALFAMAESMKAELQRPEREIKRRVKIDSPDLAALLVDFLSEALYLTQVNKEIYNVLQFRSFSDTEVTAELKGKKVEMFGEDIKAVTYHNLDVRQRKDGAWQTTILFDI